MLSTLTYPIISPYIFKNMYNSDDSYWLFPSRRESSGSGGCGGCGAAPSSRETWSDGDGGMAMVIMRDGDGDAGGWSS